MYLERRGLPHEPLLDAHNSKGQVGHSKTKNLHIQVMFPVAFAYLRDSLLQRNLFAGRACRRITIRQRIVNSRTLTRKLMQELITSRQVRFEPCCKMMGNERGETLVATRTDIQSTIKRMKSGYSQRWCISNVVQVRRSKKRET